jgi:hypothetical protein
MQGYPIDTGDFISWINTATAHGIRPFYNIAGFVDYPPFSVYLFWAFGSFGKAVGISTANIVKLIPNLFDLGTALLIYVFVRKQASFKSALLATVLYTFNPAVIYMRRYGDNMMQSTPSSWYFHLCLHSNLNLNWLQPLSR